MTAVEDGFVWVCRDVTGREERDQRLRVLNRVLRHDTRNALNVVLGRTDRLADRLGGDDEDVAAILAAAENLLETSEKARKLEDALERDAADDVAVDELVRAQVAAVREDHPDADFEVSVTCDARVDERLRLAVRELLENSVEHASASDEGPAHSSQDGEAGVQTGDTDDTGDTPEVKVSVTPDPLSVRVSDDGPGVPEHERRALSGVEETALQHGSGLGLWLVYWAVRQTGGVVEATDDGAVVVWPAGKN